MRTIYLGRLGICLALSVTAACGKVGEEPSADAAPNPIGGAISPDHGPLAGGTTVTLTGTGFQNGEAGDVRVVVGGLEAANVVVVSDTELTFETPSGLREADVVDVTAFNQSGFTTLPLAYRYNALPVLTAISPAVGPIGGGTEVTFTGHGFQVDDAGTPSILIGGAPLTNVQVVDDETVTGTTTAITATAFSKLNVAFTNANGDDSLDEAFRVTKQGLLVLERRNGPNGPQKVRWIDPSNGTVAELPQVSGLNLKGCGEGPDGQIYCATYTGQLVTYDPMTGLSTIIGPTNDASDVNVPLHGLATAGTTLYGIPRHNSGFNNLYTVDTATGLVTLVAAIAIGAPANLAAKDDTSMYLASTANGVLRLVTTAGVVSNGPTMNGLAIEVNGTAMIGGSFFMGENRGARVFAVNPTSGEVTLLATLPFSTHTLMKTPASF